MASIGRLVPWHREDERVMGWPGARADWRDFANRADGFFGNSSAAAVSKSTRIA
jgi:hypothetical protein